MACGYADVGCPTNCAQEDLAAHERDGVVAHVGLLRQRLADTSADLAQTRAQLAASRAETTQCQAALAQTKADLTATTAALAATKADLGRTQQDLAQTKTELGARLAATEAGLGQTQHDLAQTKGELAQCSRELTRCCAELALTKESTQSHIDRLCLPPAAPEGLEARWDATTKEVALDWQPVPAEPAWFPQGDILMGPPVCYRVQATLVVGGGYGGSPGSSSVVYMGPECRCRYRFPHGAAPGWAEARFVAVALRGLVESGPSTAVTCRPSLAPTQPATPAQVFHSLLAVHPTHFFPVPPPLPHARAPPPAIEFHHDHDMDERGLFYYLGTQGRTQPWRNPAEAGWVITTRSSSWDDGGASDALGREQCDCCTGDEPNAWWQVDLGAERLFRPTRYTLRHSNAPADVVHRLQSWRLEGSVDGAEGNWRTLDEHTNEPNAIPARVDAMVTFTVAPERAFPARRFRVLMTGPSPSGFHYLVLGGLEMYGSLSDPAQ
ncbi:hypothetical protein PAPYR_10262 [Paratrimastix pyriformis]|uniref:F5/8 type C domain-containing protein n=1 Tax=Paratrimastix pyriformis TaxID=342808 RepID=A0ABQ8U6B8_9EUKA|nr:hypothetical protein PAPYR_10262 [Paratrimastix pyriformis]